MKARAATQAAGRAGIDTFLKELAWREFYFAILHHFPNVLDEEFNADWRGLPWDQPGAGFEAWQQGRTGFPIVDAGMRELLATGFMHNRVRMITAMFLTKDLHVDWKQGESHFMRISSMVKSPPTTAAGSGPPAPAQTPRPISGSKTRGPKPPGYDPAGVYIKRWIPELAGVHPSRFMRAACGRQAPRSGIPPALSGSPNRTPTHLGDFQTPPTTNDGKPIDLPIDHLASRSASLAGSPKTRSPARFPLGGGAAMALQPVADSHFRAVNPTSPVRPGGFWRGHPRWRLMPWDSRSCSRTGTAVPWKRGSAPPRPQPLRRRGGLIDRG